MPEFRVVPYRGKFAVEWYEGGKRHRASLGTDDYSQIGPAMQRFAAEREAASRPEVVTVAYVAGKYRGSLEGKASAATFDHYWKALDAHFGAIPADSVTEAHCLSYAAMRRKAGRAEGTIWSELGRLRSALRHGEKKALIGKAPAIVRPEEPPPRDVRMTREEAQRFLAACDLPHVRLFAILAMTTAARMGALLGLTWDRVDFERGLIYLKDPELKRRAKGRATVPLTPSARTALADAVKGARTPYVIEWAGERVATVKKAIGAAGERAGLPWVTAHVFRHSAATWMAEDGVSMPEIAQLLGHKDSRVTERIYARFSPAYLHKASSSLDRVVLSGSYEPTGTNAKATKRPQKAAIVRPSVEKDQ